MVILCAGCGRETTAQRRTKRFCSTICAQRFARGWPKTRACRHCGAEFWIRERADANRQHCSKQCAKRANTKNIKGWLADNPDAMRRYNQTRLEKNPGAWREKSRADRVASLVLLGGQCVVCGIDNSRWLHIDFIPTTRDLRFRHPRHLAYIRAHPDQFRVLCANHHYELTLTGTIEGTAITQ